MVSTLPFSRWLGLPTFFLMVASFLVELPEDLSARKARQGLLDIHSLHKEKRRELKTEDEFRKWREGLSAFALGYCGEALHEDRDEKSGPGQIDTGASTQRDSITSQSQLDNDDEH
jgi:hypothetical protein